VAGSVALGVTEHGSGGLMPLPILATEDEHRQRMPLEVLPVDPEDLPADEFGVVRHLVWSRLAAHDAKATPVSASKRP